MGKNDKKGKKSGERREIDKSSYIRHPEELGEVVGEHAEVQRLVGRIANIEEVFPPWNIEGEKWDEPVPAEELKEVIYPNNLKISCMTTIKEYYNLPDASTATDSKSKKKDKKKAEVVEEIVEVLQDDQGNPLPVLFREDPPAAVEKNEDDEEKDCVHPDIDDDLSLSSTDRPVSFQQFRIPRGFRRAYSTDQIKFQNQVDSVKRKIDELVEGGEEANAKQLSKAQAELAAITNQRNIEEEGPQGNEIDPFLCQAFRMLHRFVAVVVKQTKSKIEESTEESSLDAEQHEDTNTKKILGENYLWRAIYPKLPNGKPYLNPAGKYCVKLYLAGKWRKVYVDDSIPLRADGLPAVASSENRFELWPLILAKAIYTVYSACGYSTQMSDITEEYAVTPKNSDDTVTHPACHKIAQFVAFAMHLSTGWQPHTPISIAHSFKKERAKSAKMLQDIIAEGICKIEEEDIVVDDSLFTLTARTDTDEEDENCEYDEFDDVSVSGGGSMKGFGEAIKKAASASLEAAAAAQQNSNLTSSSADAQSQQKKSELRPVHRQSSIEETPEHDDAEDECEDEGDEEEDDDDGDSSSSSSTSSGDRDLYDVNEARSVNSGMEHDLPDGTYRTTKRKFKKEYQKRQIYRTVTEQGVIDREQRIAKINKLLDHLLTEITFIVLYDESKKSYRTVPLLGISYNSSKPYDLMKVRFLVEWQTSKPIPTPFDPNPTPEELESTRVNGVDDGPLPMTTPLKQEWMSIRELVRRDAFMIGLDTQTMTTHGADICWHWVPLVKLPEEMLPPPLEGEQESQVNTTVSKKESANKKEKGKGAESSNADIKKDDDWYAYAGSTPVTLLKFNTKEFYATQKPRERYSMAKQKFSKRQGSSVELLARAMNDLVDEEEGEDSVHSSPDGSPTKPEIFRRLNKQPKAEYLHFSVTIHADVVTQYHEPNPEALTEAERSAIRHYSQPGDEERDAESIREEQEITNALKSYKKYRKLPSDVTLVLQEIRLDNVVPMIFVMDMKDHTFLPVVTKSFAISSNRLPKNPNEPLIFWVRLFSKTSVYLHFSSEVSIEIDEAEKIWSDLGRAVFKREGQMAAIRQKTQQLIFRLPLIIDPGYVAEHHPSLGSYSNASPTHSPVHSRPSSRPGTSGSDQQHFESKCALSFLYVHDRQIERNISLATLPHDNTKSVSPFPRIQGNLLQMSTDPSVAQQLIARVFPSYLPDCEHPIVRPFYWKLLMLSEQPLQEPPKPIHLDQLSQRYFGRYFSNNRRLLFRDIYKIEKYSFPLAFRMVTKHKRPPSRSKEALEMKARQLKQSSLTPNLSHSTQTALRRAFQVKNRTNDLTLLFRMYRYSDMKLVAELPGREGVLCYHMPLEPFLEDGETYDVAAATAKKEAEAAAAVDGGKGKKAGTDKKKNAADNAEDFEDCVQVLVECVMDEYTMNIPVEWVSRFPHMFDLHFGPSPVDAEFDMNFDKDHLKTAVEELHNSIEDQRKLLSDEPPYEPQAHWRMDILAGHVLEVCHDTRELEKYMERKNKWEDEQAGRAERAAAAKAYFIERRSAESAQATLFTQFKAPGVTKIQPSSQEMRSSLMATRVGLTDTMAESLVKALTADLEKTKKRYSTLHSVPKFVDKPNVMEEAESDHQKKKSFMRQKTQASLEEDDRTQMREQYFAEKADAEQRYRDVSERFVMLNVKMQEETKQRVDELVGEALTDATELGQLWEPREKFRSYVAERNESLAGLLKRACEAKAVALKAEEKAAEEATKLAEKLRKEEEKKAKKAKK